MSTDTNTMPCPFEWTGRLEGTPMGVFLSAAVDRDVVIGWHRPGPHASSIVIMIGGEQLSLEFFDEQSLQRLRDVADHAIPQLRAATAKNEGCNDEL
jgi:hypothetical protein